MKVMAGCRYLQFNLVSESDGQIYSTSPDEIYNLCSEKSAASSDEKSLQNPQNGSALPYTNTNSALHF
jgi:hypothetical protein